MLGVYSREWLSPLAYALKELGCEEAMVVHGIDGLDEISVIGKTSIVWLRDGEVFSTEITPKDFGFKIAKPEEISGSTPEESAELAFKLLNDLLDDRDPKRNMVLLNAAAGMVIGGKADSLSNGIELAAESIESGEAYRKLRMMIEASGGETLKLEELERKYA